MVTSSTNTAAATTTGGTVAPAMVFLLLAMVLCDLLCRSTVVDGSLDPRIYAQAMNVLALIYELLHFTSAC